ncbi:unnamed protein product, partial [Pylaiella littoralis]
MHRNLSASRRPPKPAARRRRRISSSSSSSYPTGRGGASSQRTSSARRAALLSCAALLFLVYYNSKPAKPAEPSVAGKTGGGAVEAVGAVGGVGGFGGVIGPIFNPDQSPDETDGGWEVVETWNEQAGWGGIPSTELEEWAPLGPDPQGALPRTGAEPQVVVGWGFEAQQLTLYTYRALESILHVYPEAHVRFITIGPRFAYYYKWANILSLTQFQKYSKRGYDVKVEIFTGQMSAKTKVDGKPIPGNRWWQRHEKSLLYGGKMTYAAFQAVQDALPDAYVTIYLALLELYKSGGIYVDLTTFFVRPLPAHLDGFVAGGEGPGSDGGLGDCSRPSPGNRRHRPFVMQYHDPRHPVVACALGEFDAEVSSMNECIALSKADGYGGMNCVLKTLERCTDMVGLTNDLREAGVVKWHECNDETARGYASVSSTSGADALEAIAAIPPRLSPLPASSETSGVNGSAVSAEEMLPSLTGPSPPETTATGEDSTADVEGGMASVTVVTEREGNMKEEDVAELVTPSSTDDDDDDNADGGEGGDKSSSSSKSSKSSNIKSSKNSSIKSSKSSSSESSGKSGGKSSSSETSSKSGGKSSSSSSESSGKSSGKSSSSQAIGMANSKSNEEAETEEEREDEEVGKENRQPGVQGEGEELLEKVAASATDNDESGEGGDVGGGDVQGRDRSDGRLPPEVAEGGEFIQMLAGAGIDGEDAVGAGLEERSDEEAEQEEEEEGEGEGGEGEEYDGGDDVVEGGGGIGDGGGGDGIGENGGSGDILEPSDEGEDGSPDNADGHGEPSAGDNDDAGGGGGGMLHASHDEDDDDTDGQREPPPSKNATAAAAE